MIPHALERAPAWAAAWRDTGRLVLLLDFDGTLAPIVARPELAAMPPGTRRAVERILALPGVSAAVVSGRGLADARERAGLPNVAYAGNHGMEIEAPGLSRIHPEAAAARPRLERVRDEVARRVADVPGSIVEDKGLTLSVHYRMVDRPRVDEVRAAVSAAVGDDPLLRVTQGKEVLEIRPRVEWDKGRAVDFLLEQIAPPAGVPVLYLGDDTTDEDAFRALRSRFGAHAAGVIVADPVPEETVAAAYLRGPGEVPDLLDALASARESA